MFFYFLLQLLISIFISSFIRSEHITYYILVCPKENITTNYCFKLWNILTTKFSSNCDDILKMYSHLGENQQLLIIHAGENQQLINVVSAIFSCDFLYSVTLFESKDLNLISGIDGVTLIIMYSNEEIDKNSNVDNCNTYWIEKQDSKQNLLKMCNNTRWFISESVSAESVPKVSISNKAETEFYQNTIDKKTLRVAVSSNYLPFIDCFIDSNDQVTCQGSIKEILDIICFRLNCKLQYVFPVDDYYGSEINGTWYGLVGQVYRQEVDLAAAALSMTYARTAVIDFSSPFYFESIGSLIRQPIEPITLFKFVFVFPFTIWAAIITVVIGSVLITYAFSKFAIDPSSVASCSRLQDCILCIYKVLVVQTGPISVTNWSSRIFQLGSRMCIFLMITTYTGSLIATLTSKRAYVPFNDLEGLTKEIASGQYKICMNSVGAFFSTVMESDLSDYKIIKKFLESNPSYIGELDACVDKFLNEDNVALVEEILSLEYVQGKYCHEYPTYLLSNRLYPSYFGFAFPKNSTWNPIMSLIITETVEKGFVNYWSQKYKEPESRYCQVSTPNGIYQAEIKPLSLVDIGVAFIILTVGTAVCFAILFVEYKKFEAFKLSHCFSFGNR